MQRAIEGAAQPIAQRPLACDAARQTAVLGDRLFHACQLGALQFAIDVGGQ